MSDTIMLLSDLDKIRQRPGMYIGDNDKTGLHTIVREIIDNAVDEFVNYPDKTKPIEITIAKDNVVTVRDYGRGISPYPSKKEKGEIEERLAFSRMGAGGKFRENRAKNGNIFSGGLHGTGAAGANAMSDYFEVVIYKDGYIFNDRFDHGVPSVKLIKGNLPKVKQTTKPLQTGTEITFKPSLKYLRTVKIDVNRLHEYLTRVAYLNPELTIHLTNERDDEDCVTYHAPNGLFDYMASLAIDTDDKPVRFLVEPFEIFGKTEVEVMGRINHMQMNIVTGFTRGESFAAEALTNGVLNPAGGTHLRGYYLGLVRLLQHYYAEFQTDFTTKYKTELELIRKVNNLSNVSEVFTLIKPRNISRATYVILDFKHDDPILKPQTKEELASPEARDAVADIFYSQAMLYLDRNVPAIHELIGFLIKDLYDKAKANNTKVNINRDDMRLAASSKLAAAKSKDPSKKEIFIVEGDSAGGTIKTQRDSRYQAVLPLRGKVANAKRTTLAKLLDNAEIATLIHTVGTGIGSQYNPKKLAYDRIIIATDQDIDGLHIRVLLVTFILEYMPQLIDDGHVYYLDTPLYVNVMAGKAEDVYIYSEQDQVDFVAKNGKKIVDVQRKKGLGELTDAQVEKAILNADTRHLSRLTIDDADSLADMVEMLMGSDVTGRRRLFTGGNT